MIWGPEGRKLKGKDVKQGQVSFWASGLVSDSVEGEEGCHWEEERGSPPKAGLSLIWTSVLALQSQAYCL